MRIKLGKRSGGRSAQRRARAVVFQAQNLESRVLLSAANLSSYSTLVTDIQGNGVFASNSAYVNGAVNASSGPYQYPSIAVAEFDPSNSTIFPGSNTLAAPSSAATLTATAATTGGTLAASTTYKIEVTYTTAAGETAASSATSITTPAGTNTNSITLSLPALPSGVTGENVYVGTGSGSILFNGSVTSPSSSTTNYYTITAPSTSSTVAPTTNTAGIIAPPGAATFTTSATGGSLPASMTYYVKYTWFDGNGETTASAEQSVATGATGTATNSIVLTAPAAPAGTTGMRVYVGTSPGAELFNGSPASVSTTVNNSYTITTSDSVPAANTSGLLNPSAAPTLAAYTAGGSLAKSTTYYVKYTWVSATGETLASSEASVATTSATTTNFIGVTAPAAPPGATAMNVYVGTSSGNEIYNGRLPSPSTSLTNFYAIITPPPTTQVPPSANAAFLFKAPSLTVVAPTSGGTLAPSTTYFVEYTYKTASGETTVSPESSVTTGPNSSTNSISISLGTFPTGVTSANVYVGTASGAETFNGTTTTTSYTITVPSAGGAAAAPTINTTVNTSGSSSTGVPTNLSFTLINNPGAYNSSTGSPGNPSSGSFDVYLLPTYVAPIGTSLVYLSSTAAGLPIGLQGQGGLSGVAASNYLLGNFTPAAAGPVTVNLTLPTGSAGATNAAATLTNDLNLGIKFELAIVPHTAGSSAEFEGEHEFIYNSGGAVSPASASAAGVASANSAGDEAFDESPRLALTTSNAAESVAFPYGTSTSAPIYVNQSSAIINPVGHVEIDVDRTGYAGDSASVNWTTANGTGLAGTDFGTAGSTDNLTGTLTFAPYQTVAVISIPVIGTSTTDKTFTIKLSSPSTGDGTTISASSTATNVTIVGKNNVADTIGGNVQDLNTKNNSFVLGGSATSIRLGQATTSTYAAISGSATNGADQYGTQQYVVMSFNASAIQQSEAVTGLTSLSLELDNYNSLDGGFTDGNPFPSPNGPAIGNFNVYLLNSSPTSTPTSGFAFQGQDPNSGGINTQGTPVLLGTASFTNQDTTNSPTSSGLGFGEGIQDTYSLELSAAAQSELIADLNGTSNSAGQIRLAIAPGSSSFAADFANNNSGTGGNYGIQPYLWLTGSTVTANLPPESFAVNYQNISVGANESEAVVDVVRPASGFIGDPATVTYQLSPSSLYTGPSTGSVVIPANQSVGTILIPLADNSSETAEQSFTITLTGAVPVSDTNGPTFSAIPTTITLTPVAKAATGQTLQTELSDNNGAAETNSTGLFTGYAYLNGSVTNGTGSFAFQGYQVIEFQPSEFVQPGQQLTSLTNFSLGLGNYENQQSAPGSNYGGPPGNFNIYLAGDDESATEQNRNFAASISSGGDPATYNASAVDGVGGFTGTPPGPLTPPLKGRQTPTMPSRWAHSASIPASD